MRTQVGIVGAGPAGLFLALLLQRAGIELRGAGVAQPRLCRKPRPRRRAGAGHRRPDGGARRGDRLRREGMPDTLLDIRYNGGIIHIDMPKLTPGKIVTVYGQQEVVKDLIAAGFRAASRSCSRPRPRILRASTGERPIIHFKHEGESKTLECDFIAGCDGFHGICRPAIPSSIC